MTSKKSTLFFSSFICIAGALLFYLKYTVVDIEDRIRIAKRDLALEKRNRHILKAEWKALTTPERVQNLNLRYLKMSQIEPKQLKEYDSALFHSNKKRQAKSAKRLSKLISEMLEKNNEEE